jgi:hypothetical protein
LTAHRVVVGVGSGGSFDTTGDSMSEKLGTLADRLLARVLRGFDAQAAVPLPVGCSCPSPGGACFTVCCRVSNANPTKRLFTLCTDSQGRCTAEVAGSC